MGCLEGRRALVTGAGKGLGRAISLELAREGADVIVNARSVDTLETLRAEIEAMGRRCVIAAGDVCAEKTAQAMADAAASLGGLDILVNNAGINDRNKTLQTTVKDFARIIDVNLISVFAVTQKLLPMLIEAKGCIVNITSSAGKAPHPNANPAYGASKAALTMLTKELALEFADKGVRVNAVQCGPIETEMTTQWTPEYRQKVMAAVPVGRIGTPQEVARAVVYLAGPDAGFITGASLNINGGKLME